MILCPSCEAENESGASACVHCGDPLLLDNPTRHEGGPAASAADAGTRHEGGARHERGSARRTNLPPALAERFEVIDRLRGGNEADVLVVTDQATQEQRVLKLYHPHIELDERAVGILERESATEEGSKHLAELCESGQSEYSDGERCWYEVLEYCQEGSLRDLMTAADPTDDPQ